MFKSLYWYFSHVGIMVFSATFILGFRHAPDAPSGNLWFNVALYTAFILAHIAMTIPAFKKLLYGRPEGAHFERQVYVVISIVSYSVVYWLHKPVPGFAYASPAWLEYIGVCAVLLSVVAFFEFATFEALGSLLGVPGYPLSHSVGAETPLMKEGPYSKVRHPMYRAAFFIGFCSLLIHPNSAQLVFAVLVSLSFLGFIPFEEHQLIKARGDEYRNYKLATPYRVLQGIW